MTLKFHSSLIAMVLPVCISFCPVANAALVAAYEFTADGNTLDWTAATTSSFTTTGGFLVGTASGNDPQLLITPPTSITVGAGNAWTTLEFRVREYDDATSSYLTTFNSTGLVIQVNVGGTPITINSPASFTAGSLDANSFFTVTADISSLGSVTINNLRVDVIGGALSNSGSETNGNSFEVDYIRLNNNAVPEPCAALLGGLGLIVLFRRRR